MAAAKDAEAAEEPNKETKETKSEETLEVNKKRTQANMFSECQTEQEKLKINETKSKSNLSKTNNLAATLQEQSAVQYVAKLRAKLVADSNARMGAAKITVTKVVIKSQQVGPVQRPLTASYVGSRVSHKDVKDVEDVEG